MVHFTNDILECVIEKFDRYHPKGNLEANDFVIYALHVAYRFVIKKFETIFFKFKGIWRG